MIGCFCSVIFFIYVFGLALYARHGKDALFREFFGSGCISTFSPAIPLCFHSDRFVGLMETLPCRWDIHAPHHSAMRAYDIMSCMRGVEAQRNYDSGGLPGAPGHFRPHTALTN